MKKSLFVLALFAATSAQALDIYPTGICNGSCVCSGVETSDPEISLNLTPTSMTFPDATTYTGSETYPAQWVSKDGKIITVSLEFRRWTTKTTSGRVAGHPVPRCAVVGGTVK